MNWLWLNASVGAAFVLPVAGAPLWLVLKHPDIGPYAAGQSDAPSLSSSGRDRRSGPGPPGMGWPPAR